MRHTRAFLAGIVVFVLLAPSRGVAEDPLAPVSWLAGCWSFTANGRTVDEQWMRPAGGVMLGMSRAVREGRAPTVEFVVLRVDGGRLVYDARPEGQTRTLFPLAKSGADEVVFENPAHDFPQRVIYRRVGADQIRARVEGRTSNGEQGFDYPFTRVACP
jgi:hypothetical protein